MSFKQTKKHCVYHLLPKGDFIGKVGATSNVEERVNNQQGCTVYGTDYVILRETDDMKTASDTEIHFQKMFGYAVDPTSYFDLMNKNKAKVEVSDSEVVSFTFAKNKQWYSVYHTNDRAELIAEISTYGFEIDGITYNTDAAIAFATSSVLQKSRWNGFYISARAMQKFIAAPATPETVTENGRQQNVCADLEVSEQPFVNLNDVFEMQKSLQMKFPETANIGNETIAETAVAAQRNLHAFLDEMMEYMDALGGIEDGIKNGGWKYWKQDNAIAKEQKISDLSERDLKELKMEFVDMFHFFINWGLMIGMTGNEVISYYVAKNKENFDRQARGY